MNNILFTGFGGFLGSILRYIFSGYVQGLLRSADFPYGTMAVNITGCLMIGILSQLEESQGHLPMKRVLFGSSVFWADSRPFQPSVMKQ